MTDVQELKNRIIQATDSDAITWVRASEEEEKHGYLIRFKHTYGNLSVYVSYAHVLILEDSEHSLEISDRGFVDQLNMRIEHAIERKYEITNESKIDHFINLFPSASE